MISFIQKHLPQNSGKLLLQKSLVHQSCKAEFEDKRTNQLITQNYTTHADNVTEFEVTTHSGVKILIWSRTRTARIIDTVATGLCFFGKKTKRWRSNRRLTSRSYTTPASEPKDQIREIALPARGTGTCCVLHTLVWGPAVLLGLASGLNPTIGKMIYSSSKSLLTSRPVVMRTPGSVTLSGKVW